MFSDLHLAMALKRYPISARGHQNDGLEYGLVILHLASELIDDLFNVHPGGLDAIRKDHITRTVNVRNHLLG
jgi:hypothetical protein